MTNPASFDVMTTRTQSLPSHPWPMCRLDDGWKAHVIAIIGRSPEEWQADIDLLRADLLAHGQHKAFSALGTYWHNVAMIADRSPDLTDAHSKRAIEIAQSLYTRCDARTYGTDCLFVSNGSTGEDWFTEK